MIAFIYLNSFINLPSPRLNDSENLILPAVIHRAKDGTIHAFRKLSVPISSLSLFFENVNRPKIIEYFTFLRATSGKQITYLDYRGQKWIGSITNRDTEAVHAAIRNNQFTVDFEGHHA